MANSEYISHAISAVKRLHAAIGNSATFPFDQIWAYLPDEATIPSGKRPSLAKPLVTQGYLKPTGRRTNAVTLARAGAPTTEYGFGRVFLGSEALLELTGGMERAKPFLILAGPSGTGKSRWVRQQALLTWNGDERPPTPPNYQLIPVKPNWHDSSELLGYVTRFGVRPECKAKYVTSEFVRFLVRAWSNPGVPHWLCLDEMNLAPVEQYFAEYLSVIESRRLNGVFIIDGIPEARRHKGNFISVQG